MPSSHLDRQRRPYKTPESVLVLVHTPALDILLLERAGKPGYWQSVTGSREPGEDFASTAVREVAEETGIDATAYRLRAWPLANRFEIFAEWRHRYAPGVSHNLEHVFALEIPEPQAVQLAPGEHDAYRWLGWEAAAEAVFSWTNRDAILLLAGRHRR